MNDNLNQYICFYCMRAPSDFHEFLFKNTENQIWRTDKYLFACERASSSNSLSIRISIICWRLIHTHFRLRETDERFKMFAEITFFFVLWKSINMEIVFKLWYFKKKNKEKRLTIILRHFLLDVRVYILLKTILKLVKIKVDFSRKIKEYVTNQLSTENILNLNQRIWFDCMRTCMSLSSVFIQKLWKSNITY